DHSNRNHQPRRLSSNQPPLS
ncbi:hypothetical protein, partial [uncultured Gammaproteobacteria bacterium]